MPLRYLLLNGLVEFWYIRVNQIDCDANQTNDPLHGTVLPMPQRYFSKCSELRAFRRVGGVVANEW